MSEQAQAQQEGIISRFLSTIVFWWLTAMAMVTLALAATIPSWVEYRQVVALRDQMQHEVQQFQRQVDRNNYFIDSYRTSPQALDLLAISEFGYRRPDEAPLPLPQQIASSFRPAGFTGMSNGRGVAGPASRPAEKPAEAANAIERQVERAQALANHYLGTRRAIGLVEMFCDKATRTGLVMAALGVLTAALFLCRAGTPARDLP